MSKKLAEETFLELLSQCGLDPKGHGEALKALHKEFENAHEASNKLLDFNEKLQSQLKAIDGKINAKGGGHPTTPEEQISVLNQYAEALSLACKSNSATINFLSRKLDLLVLVIGDALKERK